MGLSGTHVGSTGTGRKSVKAPAAREGGLMSFIEGWIPIPASELSVFFNQLSCLYNAGFTITNSLRLIAEQSQNRRFEKILRDMKHQIECGTTFAAAINSYSQIFSRPTVALINSGEISGSLDVMLSKAAALKEKELALSRKIIQAATYPVIVFFSVLLFIFFMGRILLNLIIPILTANSTILPLYTRMLIFFYHVLCHPLTILGVIAVFALSFKFLRQKLSSESMVLWRDKLLCSLPLVGPLFQKIALSRFCNALAVLFDSGITIMSGVRLAAEASGNRQCLEDSKKLVKFILDGRSMNEGMKELSFFPPAVQDMIKVGEESGALPKLLAHTSSFMEADVDYALIAFSSALEPLLIAFLGFAVALLAFAVLYPMQSIFTSLGG